MLRWMSSGSSPVPPRSGPATRIISWFSGIAAIYSFLRYSAAMLPSESQLSVERRAHLLERLQRTGRLVTSDAAASSGVSVDTIRRDLAVLEELGQARRVHGGAVLQSSLPRS